MERKRDDCLNLSANAVEILRKRYLSRDPCGRVSETPAEMFERVASHVSQAESRYGGDREVWRAKFLEMMEGLEFLPNSPMLMNAGLP
ncbi:MAG: ribonucleotide reductase N-terminal alpha domain-containing protein, partial [Candidatus Omnitrophica bacterium]|nr:ribonucleotide reductase N-terminal alpha domain-containing protein [Candidatus Omnitrophota bacterium]